MTDQDQHVIEWTDENGQTHLAVVNRRAIAKLDLYKETKRPLTKKTKCQGCGDVYEHPVGSQPKADWVCAECWYDLKGKA